LAIAAWPTGTHAQGDGAGLEGLLTEFVEETLATEDPLVLAAEGEAMHGNDLAALETKMAAQPNDLPTRSRLLGFYASNAMPDGTFPERRREHVLWLIRNHPAEAIAGSRYARIDPAADADGFKALREAWIEQTRAHPNNADVLFNAARGLMRWDLDLTEMILKRGETIQPADPAWPEGLGMLYALHWQKSEKEACAALREKALAAYDRALEMAGTTEAKIPLSEAAARAALALDAVDAARRHARRLVTYGSNGRTATANLGETLMGLAALEKGEMDEAKGHLKASAKVGGAWKDGDAPSMELAAALAQRGEKAAVVEYLKACEAIFPDGVEKLEKWRTSVEKGELPAEWVEGKF
jgi:tetratricopeptide (TPR) repeat protein